MAQTICYVQEHGIDTYDDLVLLRSSKEQAFQKLQKQDPSYQTLRAQVREIQIVCKNVDSILHSYPLLQKNRSTEKAWDTR